MAISQKDIKKLFGLAAGLCSFPGCSTDCLVLLEHDDPIVIGQMAHVISQSPVGPRGAPEGGADSYANLILLCPTHHVIVDTAPDARYPADLLLDWKSAHETAIRERLSAPSFESRTALASSLLNLMAQNHSTWLTYGPESETAQRNPISNVVRIWELRKLSVIIPNNRRIVAALEAHRHYFSSDEQAIIAAFIEHAAGFEASALERREDVPRFPRAFQELITRASTE